MIMVYLKCVCEGHVWVITAFQEYVRAPIATVLKVIQNLTMPVIR